MTEDPSEWLVTAAPETFRYVVYLNGEWSAFSSVRERVSEGLMRNPNKQLLIQTREPAMSSVFAIYNLVTKQVTTTAPTPELIEREYHHADKYFPKRDMMQQIAEFPAVLGLTIHNYRLFPESMIMDGIVLYAKRKRNLVTCPICNGCGWSNPAQATEKCSACGGMGGVVAA